MLLGTLKKTGQLILATDDQSRYAIVPEHLAKTLQDAIDNWDKVYPALKRFEAENKNWLPMDISIMGAPLPMPREWLDSSRYPSHSDLMQVFKGQEKRTQEQNEYLVYQGRTVVKGPSDKYVMEDINEKGEKKQLWTDIEGEWFVITGKVAAGSTPETAAKSLLLVGILNDVTYRSYGPKDVQSGFGFVNAKPGIVMAPFVKPYQELVDQKVIVDGKLHATLEATIVRANGTEQTIGRIPAQTDMLHNMASAVARNAETRKLVRGTVVGSGTVSNQNVGKVGSLAIVEARMVHALATDPKYKDKGSIDPNSLDPSTGFAQYQRNGEGKLSPLAWLEHGDRVRVGSPMFGYTNTSFVSREKKNEAKTHQERLRLQSEESAAAALNPETSLGLPAKEGRSV